jgi:hypothetical protein
LRKLLIHAANLHDSEIFSKSIEAVLATLEENRKKLQSISLIQAQMNISMDEAINDFNKQATLLGDIIKAVSSSANNQEMVLSAVQDIKQTLDSSATGNNSHGVEIYTEITNNLNSTGNQGAFGMAISSGTPDEASGCPEDETGQYRQLVSGTGSVRKVAGWGRNGAWN